MIEYLGGIGTQMYSKLKITAFKYLLFPKCILRLFYVLKGIFTPFLYFVENSALSTNARAIQIFFTWNLKKKII